MESTEKYTCPKCNQEILIINKADHELTCNPSMQNPESINNNFRYCPTCGMRLAVNEYNEHMDGHIAHENNIRTFISSTNQNINNISINNFLESHNRRDFNFEKELNQRTFKLKLEAIGQIKKKKLFELAKNKRNNNLNNINEAEIINNINKEYNDARNKAAIEYRNINIEIENAILEEQRRQERIQQALREHIRIINRPSNRRFSMFNDIFGDYNEYNKEIIIKKLKLTHLQDVSQLVFNECTICLEDFISGDDIYILPCMHIFHKECISHWIRERIHCPNCRYNLLKDKYTSE